MFLRLKPPIARLALRSFANADNIAGPPPVFDLKPPAAAWDAPAKPQAGIGEAFAPLSNVVIHESASGVRVTRST
jgi:hypothetical protein